MFNSVDVAGIILPEAIKLKLAALENVNLFSSNSETYLDFGDDVQIDLDKIFNIHSFHVLKLLSFNVILVLKLDFANN